MITKFNLFENKTEYTIYCDMDGVLTDFDKSINDGFLNDWNKTHKTKIKDGWAFSANYSVSKFWDNVDKLGLSFWSDMNWTKDGKKLWDHIKELNVKILSTPSQKKESKEGKNIWCKRELNLKPILSNNKEQYANSKSILIDDLPKNINKWIDAGGIGILHKNTKSTIKKLNKII